MKLAKVILQKKESSFGSSLQILKKKEKMKIIAKQENVKKGDKFELKNSRYKYIIKDIDYSSTPNIVQMMYVDNNEINHIETFTIKLPVLLSYIKNRIIDRI